MSNRKNTPDDIRRAAKVIGLALWLGDPEAWENTIPVLEVRVSLPQRKALAFAVLCTLTDDHVYDVLASLYGTYLWEAAA